MLIATLGATLTFFGCQKDYTDDINKVREDLTAQLEQLKSDLTTAINSAKEEAQQYADAAAQAAKDYADAVAQEKADEALAAAKEYADNAAEEAAANVRTELLEEIKDQVAQALQDAKNYTDEQIDEVWSGINALDAQIAEISGRVSTLELNYAYLKDDVDALKADMTDALSRIADLEAFKTNAESRLGTLEAFKTSMEEWKGDVDSTLTALNTAITEIKGLISDLQKDIEALNGDIDRIDGILADYGLRLDDIEDDIRDINEHLTGLEGKIGNRISSISLIPETYVDGIPAITVPTITYNAITVNANTEAVTTAPSESTAPIKSATVRYNVSPNHVSVDCIGDARYLFEAASYINTTKAAVADPLFEVVGTTVNERNELVVEISRAHSDVLCRLPDNSANPTGEYDVYTAALQLGMAEAYLAEGETEAYVTSEYSAVYDEYYKIHIRKPGKPTCNHDEKYYTTFDDAKAGEIDRNVVYDGQLDLLSLVSSCVYVEGKAGEEYTAEELAEYGFAFRFELPKTFIQGAEQTNEQSFARFVDAEKTILASQLPDGTQNNKAAVGRTPIVRVELVDTDCNKVVDVQWIKIQWTEEEIPVEDIKLPSIKTFEYVLSCEDFHGELTWAEVNNLILGKLSEVGMSHDTFGNTYKTGTNDADVDGTYNDPDKTDITMTWPATNQELTTTVFAWDVDVDQIGDVMDQLLASADGTIERTVTITISPKDGVKAGKVIFSMTLVIRLPELPDHVGYNSIRWHSSAMAGELARITPVGASDKTNSAPSRVRYAFDLMQLFVPDQYGNLATNIVSPTSDPAWSCRRWDMQFSATQPVMRSYLPASHPADFAGDADKDGYSLVSALTEAAVMIPLEDYAGTTEVANWFQNGKNENLNAFKLRLHNNDVGRALLNYNATAVEDLNTIDIDIWSRINKHNHYKVMTYSVWFVNPLQITAPKIVGYFTDDHNNPSRVNIANAFDNVTDYEGHKMTETSIHGVSLKDYYGVQDPVWGYDQARINIVMKDGNLVVDNSLANTEADRAKMSPLSIINGEITLDGDELVYTRQGAQTINEIFKVYIPVVYTHEWGTETFWAEIEVRPNAATPGN